MCQASHSIMNSRKRTAVVLMLFPNATSSIQSLCTSLEPNTQRQHVHYAQVSEVHFKSYRYAAFLSKVAIRIPMDTHRFIVRELVQQVKVFYDHKQAFAVSNEPMEPAHIGHTHWAVIKTGDLNHVLDINTGSRFAMVEPNVTLEALVQETLKHGLLPLVVPPFPGTTVGSSFSSTTVGSSSYRYGFFDESLMWMEIILADGTISRASRTRNASLLSGLVNSMETIGIATLFQIMLVPVAKYVEITYIPVASSVEALETIDRCCENLEEGFIEGLVYGPGVPVFGVVITGKLAADKKHNEARFSRTRDPWFYEHALKVAGTTECVPMLDYLFRYDRGAFCMGRFCFGRMPLNRHTRWLTDTATRSKNLLATKHALDWEEHFVIQDLIVPFGSPGDLVQYLSDELEVGPLVLCPVAQSPTDEMIMRPNPLKAKQLLNIRVCGYTESTIHDARKFRVLNRNLERKVQEVGGFKFCSGRNYYSEAEFWGIYPQAAYEALREKYNAQYLPSIYERVRLKDGPRKKRVRKSFWDHVFTRTSIVARQPGTIRRKDM